MQGTHRQVCGPLSDSILSFTLFKMKLHIWSRHNRYSLKHNYNGCPILYHINTTIYSTTLQLLNMSGICFVFLSVVTAVNTQIGICSSDYFLKIVSFTWPVGLCPLLVSPCCARPRCIVKILILYLPKVCWSLPSLLLVF